MKIGIDIRTLMDARYSGVSEYAFNLLKEMFRLDAANEYQLFYNCFGDCPHIPAFAGKNVRLVKYNYPNKILNYLLFKIFQRPKIDQALGVDLFFLPHLNFISLSGRSRSVITVHDLSFLRYPEFFSARRNLWHRLIGIKKLLNRFDKIVAISENTKRDIIELCGVPADKIQVIYSGVGEEYRKIINYQLSIINQLDNFQFSNLNAEEKKLLEVKNKYHLSEKFILYLGTIEPRKNIDGVIRAYNELRSASGRGELRDYKLIIAGARGWKSDRIFQEWGKSRFKDDIKFLGYIDPADKVYLYNLAAVFVFPSFYEGFGLPVLEAMACGVPVISSFAPSLPEVVGDAALTVDPNNVKALAGALRDVLANSRLRAELVARGFKQAKKFSWEKTAKEYQKIFNF